MNHRPCNKIYIPEVIILFKVRNVKICLLAKALESFSLFLRVIANLKITYLELHLNITIYNELLLSCYVADFYKIISSPLR
ncbi:unnamed protein product [Rhizophagus irregularis]|nr:unnamed protein product [Rhizophagus irregularis]